MLQCPRCNRQFLEDVAVCPDDFTPLQADVAIADVPLDPLIGRTFDGKYRLDQRLGGGGMGTVYRGTHLLIDRPVAIKVLSQRFVGDETAQQRFRREARAAGSMQHPNAVTVNDFGTTEDGYLYIVMELLEGRTLRDLLAHEGPLDPARAVSFMLQACAAIGAAHDAKLIHRDLKPANILIEQRPNMPAIVKVLDFGVAKFAVEGHEEESLTQVGAIIGTPRYMSPEQCSGAASVTPASDVYSLGILLYEMLTGAVPFSADTPLGVALKQVSEPPRPPHEIVPIPAELERVVLHALAKDAKDRPADANELRRELHATAELLGFEHADSLVSPTMDALRQAGTESPSGRLVIDIATLRQVQAATSADNQPRARASKAATASFTNAGSVTITGSADVTHPELNRTHVTVSGPPAASHFGLKIVVGVMFVLIVGVTLFAVSTRWRRSATSANQVNASEIPAPAATPSPSPSPTPLPTPSPKRVNRAAPAPKNEKPEAKPASKPPSKAESLYDQYEQIRKMIKKKKQP